MVYTDNEENENTNNNSFHIFLALWATLFAGNNNITTDCLVIPEILNLCFPLKNTIFILVLYYTNLLDGRHLLLSVNDATDGFTS